MEHGGTLFATLAPRVYPSTFFLYHWKKLPFDPPSLRKPIRNHPSALRQEFFLLFHFRERWLARLGKRKSIAAAILNLSQSLSIDRWIDRILFRPNGRFLRFQNGFDFWRWLRRGWKMGLSDRFRVLTRRCFWRWEWII